MSDEEGDFSISKLKKKHQHELKILKQKQEQALKTAGKDKTKKKLVEKENEKQLEDLLKKQQIQIDEFKPTETIIEENEVKIEKFITNEEKEEFEKKQKKKEKNKRKTENKKKTEGENRKKIEEEIKISGGTERQKELNLIQEQLNSLGMTLKIIASDGHCLYRSVSDQIEEMELMKDLDYLKIRKIVSDEMKKNPNEYMPFLEGSDGETMKEIEFKSYCEHVENSADWGGQVELKGSFFFCLF
jgi:OTU domain-containing protein 6